ncbi:hypothetical protein [Acinetobacter towneri]|uniref:hypothetical protein n=1 Tax=Acinetobacter towneri TaxID=202956 RepID=UPI00257518B2|nr:hypothetical protein [Acinetobacter towneri]MDM1720525.1 hypothetical protein [Acinetobacter towneri]
MFSYENGLILALLMWIWGFISVIIRTNSQMSRNLKKIGKKISWFDLSLKDITYRDAKISPIKKIAFFALWFVILPFPFIFTSWVYVFASTFLFVYRVKKNFGMPQSYKEFQWKLKNIDMSFDEIIKEMMLATNQDMSKLEDVKEEIRLSMQENQRDYV